MSYLTRVKICGITSPQDAITAATYGADAIGMIFYPKSKRYVTAKQAREITTAVGPFVNIVALFVNPTVNEVKQVLEQAQVQTLQFQGDETKEFCEQFSLPYIKAVKVPSPVKDTEAAISAVQQAIIHEAQTHDSAKAILLDTLHQQHPGGTGETFDWRCVPVTQQLRWILAGGLNPANVSDAIQQVKPYAVDVCSGVEREPGIKDSAKVKAFIENAKSVRH